MDYKLVSAFTKVDGTKIESVTIKETFIGRDVKYVMNSKGEGDAQIRLVACATGLSENTVENLDARDVNEISKAFFQAWRGLGFEDGFAVLAGVFHWSYEQIMNLDSEAFTFSLDAAKKYSEWMKPKKVM